MTIFVYTVNLIPGYDLLLTDMLYSMNILIASIVVDLGWMGGVVEKGSLGLAVSWVNQG